MFGLFSVSSFFLVSAILSSLDSVPNLRGTFWWFWYSPTWYLCLIFLIGSQFIVQKGFDRIIELITGEEPVIPTKEIEAERPAGEKPGESVDFSKGKRQMTMKHHGFAFSQEAGQVPQILERLPTFKK